MDADIRKSALAKLVDCNGDGRLQASEYVRAAGGVLRRAGISAFAESNHAANALIHLNSASLHERFEIFRGKYSKCFHNGIEEPSKQDFNNLASIGLVSNSESSHCSNALELLNIERSEIDDEIYGIIEKERRRRTKEQFKGRV